MIRLQSMGAATLSLIAILLMANGGWVWAKAQVAQYLLLQSWKATRQAGDSAKPVKPWPWADTHPIAQLRVPQLEVDQLVLAGNSGRTLAFGPGLIRVPERHGKGTLTLISGHRDTHFRFLKDLEPGTAVSLETTSGRKLYRVTGQEVIDINDGPLLITADASPLVLVTCYPFDTLEPGGPLRLIVRLQQVPYQHSM